MPLHTGKNSEFHYPGFSKKQLKSPIKKVKEERKFLSPVRNQPNFNSSNFVKVAKSPATVDPSPVSLPIMTEANVKPVNSLMLTTTTTTSTSVPTTPNETVLINSSGSPAIPKLKITFGTKRKKTLTIVGGEKSTFITQNDCDSAVMAKGDRLANATIEKPAVKRPLSRSSSVDSLDELKPLVIDYEEPEEEIMPVSTIPLNEPLMSNRT